MCRQSQCWERGNEIPAAHDVKEVQQVKDACRPVPPRATRERAASGAWTGTRLRRAGPLPYSPHSPRPPPVVRGAPFPAAGSCPATRPLVRWSITEQLPRRAAPHSAGPGGAPSAPTRGVGGPAAPHPRARHALRRWELCASVLRLRTLLPTRRKPFWRPVLGVRHVLAPL